MAPFVNKRAQDQLLLDILKGVGEINTNFAVAQKDIQDHTKKIDALHAELYGENGIKKRLDTVCEAMPTKILDLRYVQKSVIVASCAFILGSIILAVSTDGSSISALLKTAIKIIS